MTAKPINIRLTALRRFAVSITILNLLGHFVLGFEQSWAQPLVALATAYSIELLLGWIESRTQDSQSPFQGGLVGLVDYLLPAHITGLAVAMLLYANDRLWPIAFATAVALGSKRVFRVMAGGRPRHFFNPSNTGITLTLLLFPWIGIAPPYHFTEHLYGWADWVLPVIIIISGTLLNHQLTGKMPLILSWLGAFVLQAMLRSHFNETPLEAALLPMTGVAFLLFTFYMLSDPATTPFTLRGQIVFGASVAGVYASLMTLHIVFGLFFALTFVCAVRGLTTYVSVSLTARQMILSPSTLLKKAG
ncbi:MAG TPA: enediyne biosynthesis protein UnbU [Acidobacteriota bacterium]|nr:enediyne biosynthesis protein UnbU [Acidobacteriota bacterium]